MIDDRKLKILKAIIDSYVKHAEPVGSRTLSKQYDLGVSSATIRNEMSDLEELGLLNKLHSSSGRTPSEKAYRYYVNYLVHRHNALSKRQQELIWERLWSVAYEEDEYVKESMQILSDLTGHTVLLITGNTSQAQLGALHLVPVDSQTVVLLLLGEPSFFRSYMVHLKRPLAEEERQKLEVFFNQYLLTDAAEFEVRWEAMEKNLNQDLLALAEGFKPYIAGAVNTVEQQGFYTYGLTRLMHFPDYGDIESLRGLIELASDEDAMSKVLWREEVQDKPHVMIGSEMQEERLEGSSIIAGDLYIDENRIGRMALLGPVRMDYGRLINVLGSYANLLNQMKLR